MLAGSAGPKRASLRGETLSGAGGSGAAATGAGALGSAPLFQIPEGYRKVEFEEILKDQFSAVGLALALVNNGFQAGVGLPVGEIGLEHLDFDFRPGSLYIEIFCVEARVHQDRH